MFQVLLQMNSVLRKVNTLAFMLKKGLTNQKPVDKNYMQQNNQKVFRENQFIKSFSSTATFNPGADSERSKWNTC